MRDPGAAADAFRYDFERGEDVLIVPPSNVYGCKLGSHVRIGPFCEIQQGVVIGSGVKIGSHTFICDGVTIEDEVFIGHGVMFCNDRYPRATRTDGQLKGPDDWRCSPILIKRGASIGTGAVIVGPCIIDELSMIGAGAVVTRNVRKGDVVVGMQRVIRGG